MSALSIRLPASLHDRVRELAAREGISINQLIAVALAEKMSALMTAEYLESRAQRGTREKFLAALARVPDVEPALQDRLPARLSGKSTPKKKAVLSSTEKKRRSKGRN